MNDRFYASHDENTDLVEQIKQMADAKNVIVRHNSSSFSKFDGQHRYLILKNDAVDFSIRSRHLVEYWETRYSQYFQPSKSGERACLRGMIAYLESM